MFNKPFDNKALEWRWLRLDIAKEYGWAVEYVDALPYYVIQDILSIRAGVNRARERQSKAK